MRYTKLFLFMVLTITVCAEAMNAQERLLRDFMLLAAVAQPELIEDNQPHKSYSQAPREDKKFVVKNHSPVQRRKKDSSNAKLCTLRCNKK